MIVLETQGLTTRLVPFKLEVLEQLSQLSSNCSLAFYTIYQFLCFDHIFFQQRAEPRVHCLSLDQEQEPLLLPLVLCSHPIMWGV